MRDVIQMKYTKTQILGSDISTKAYASAHLVETSITSDSYVPTPILWDCELKI
jgi:hypothetical protein